MTERLGKLENPHILDCITNFMHRFYNLRSRNVEIQNHGKPSFEEIIDSVCEVVYGCMLTESEKIAPGSEVYTRDYHFNPSITYRSSMWKLLNANNLTEEASKVLSREVDADIIDREQKEVKVREFSMSLIDKDSIETRVSLQIYHPLQDHSNINFNNMSLLEMVSAGCNVRFYLENNYVMDDTVDIRSISNDGSMAYVSLADNEDDILNLLFPIVGREDFDFIITNDGIIIKNVANTDEEGEFINFNKIVNPSLNKRQYKILFHPLYSKSIWRFVTNKFGISV